MTSLGDENLKKSKILKLDFYRKRIDNESLSDIGNEFKHFPNYIKRINLLLA